jgi:hypothetical protein
MITITRDDIRKLIDQKTGPCISIYIPTHRTGKEVRQDPIRFKNLLRKAELGLKEDGLRDIEVRKLLQPAQEILEDEFFWTHQLDGMAAFLCPDLFMHFRQPRRFEELVAIGHSFHLKPLLPLLTGDGRYYVLALGQKNPMLLQCTRYGVAEIALENVAGTIEEALQFDDFQRQSDMRSVSPQGGGERQMSYHGKGPGVDDAKHKKDILRYFQMVDRAVQKSLKGQKVPLVLFGAGYLLPIYREINTWPDLLPEAVEKDPQNLSLEGIRDQAWELVQEVFRKERSESLARIRQTLGTGRASRDLNEIVPASVQGRVDSLFVEIDGHRWGRFDQAARSVEYGEKKARGFYDLLDFAAVHTLLQDGKVFALEPDEIAGPEPAAALFRY